MEEAMNSELQFFVWVMAGGFVLLLILMYEILKRLNSIDRHLANIAGETQHNDTNLGEIGQRLVDLTKKLRKQQ
jgi:hypothetical protein